MLAPFKQFAAVEASAGILLFAFAVVALIWANSGLGVYYEQLFGTYVTVGFGAAELSKPLLLWVNDGLMAIFFLLVGLEIKRELLSGELSSPRKAALPFFAAAGGMAIPAGLYLTLNLGGAGESGWGIPMATDIAFALAVITALGSRVPLSLKVFLTAVAIVDDLGAVMVIALFYTSEVSTQALMVAASALVGLIIVNRAGFKSFLPYAILGAVLWVAVLKSGVHATVAGVLLAMTIPAKPDTDPEGWDSPLEKLEHALLPWVSYTILPIFALANAGVTFGGDAGAGAGAITWGIILGLVVGKPIGVAIFAWIAVRFGFADLPAGANWVQVWGVGILCGIGFTMSLFIGGLAFDDPAFLRAAKIGILGASAVAGVLGALLLLRAPSAPTSAGAPGEREAVAG
ncbi:MAG: Na+/H+ antiporter NhaA [Gemmatimonadetes bacterium]|nr:Na+/H+ antiporter NhaA [Gemmatimonadota bacterium]